MHPRRPGGSYWNARSLKRNNGPGCQSSRCMIKSKQSGQLPRRCAVEKQRRGTTAYRYPHERLILALTIALVFVVIALTAAATLLLSALFVAAIVAASYASNKAHHEALIQRAWPITSQQSPRLAAIIKESAARIQPGHIQAFVALHNTLNAYTFGLLPPRVIVLHSPLLEVMDEDEMRFIIGHEMGHIRLGHTWLNSLVGGMAGIPSPFLASAMLVLAFRWWNRACEYSADRAGMLACGKPHKAISALVKLAIGPIHTRAEWERALRIIDAEDDTILGNLNEMLASHPMIIRRIERLKLYATSAQYRRLQELINRDAANLR